MTLRLSRPTAGIVVALAAGLLALPACKKKDDGPPGGPMGISSMDRNAMRDSQKNLKQIGLGMHSYHDVHNSLPIGIVGPDGKTPGLSWRVQILPYIEQENLYKMFKLDEPWDSENNKKLLEMMPKTYTAPETDSAKGLTYYRSFTGPGTLIYIHPKASSLRPGQPFRGPSLFSIFDGSSNTLMAVEAGEAVPWTKPDELVFDPNGPLPNFGGVFADGMNALLCDGSVRFIKGDTPEATLKALITTTGGEVVELP